MASITISSGASAVTAVMDKTRVVQTRRDAEQAQNLADGLRREADDANRVAQVSQNNARELAERSNQLLADYVQSENMGGAGAPLVNAGMVPRLYASTQPSASPLLPLVVNTQGQATGQLVNLIA